MKKPGYQFRFYRKWSEAFGLRPLHYALKETDLYIFTDKIIPQKFIAEKVAALRRDIESYISKDPRFFSSLKPVAVELSAAAIIRQMAKAAAKAGVGPMAAVAGAISAALGKALLKQGCREVIIENGGDVFLKIRKARSIGIYAGKKRLFNKLTIIIRPQDTPLGICSSSGSIGHSLSFGTADSVTILAKDAGLADAIATAVCNRAQSKKDLPQALSFARSIRGVSGACIILKNNLASWGNIRFSRR